MDPDLWERAQALFLACADLPAEERPDWLDRHCRDEPALRRAVVDLLRGDAAGASIRDSIGRTALALASRRDERWRGMQVGAYTLESRIAEGGMGVVWLARRSDRQYEQRVAVKLVAAPLATDELRSRFLAERQILASLNHAHIAHLFDGGETADGIPYLVMEYIDGTPIDRYCDSRRLTVAERLRIFLQVCAAVQYAHLHLVIHRDLKPSNILVTAEGVPKLLDFGIAKLLDESGREAALTMDGARLLTPRHASPEQVLGGRITTVSDVYSLGLLLYELLCGAFPYRIDAHTRPAEVAGIVAGALPCAPSTGCTQAPGREAIAQARGTTVDRLQRSLRGDLDTIVLKALRKEPEARYGTVQAFADDILRHLERSPILARPPTAAYLLSRYWLRHRPAVVGIVATLIAIVAGATAATVGFVQARAAERLAFAEAQNRAAISEFLVSLFREADPNTSAGAERSVREILELGLARVDTELADTPAVQSRVLETLSGVYKAQADYPAAEALLRRALAAHAAGAADDALGQARMLNDLGDLLRIQSRHADAADLIERAIDIQRASGHTLSDEHADAVNNLSLVYQESGRLEEARRAMEEALALRRQLFEAPHSKIALSLHNLAWHLERAGPLAEAERYAREAVDMRVQVFGEVHPRVAGTLELLSRIQLAQGDWAGAEASARRAVAIASQIFEGGHPDLTFPLYQLAAVLRTQGEIREASDLFRRIVEWERASLGPDSHDLGMSIKAYAATLLELAEYEPAERLLEESLAIFERLPAGSTKALEDTHTELGRLLARTGRFEAAREHLGLPARPAGARTAADRATADGALQDAPPTTTAWAFARRRAQAEYFLLQGDPAAAESLTTALLEELDERGSGVPLRKAGLLSLRAEALLAAGRADAASRDLEAALGEFRRYGAGSHWQAARASALLAQACRRLGTCPQARDLLQRALPVLERALGAGHPETLRAAGWLAAAGPSHTGPGSAGEDVGVFSPVSGYTQ